MVAITNMNLGLQLTEMGAKDMIDGGIGQVGLFCLFLVSFRPS